MQGHALKSEPSVHAVDLVSGIWYQRCHDPECRSYRSPALPLPPDAWQQGLALHSATTQPDRCGDAPQGGAAPSGLRHGTGSGTSPVNLHVGSSQHTPALPWPVTQPPQYVALPPSMIGSMVPGAGSGGCAVTSTGGTNVSNMAAAGGGMGMSLTPLTESHSELDEDEEYDRLYVAVLERLEGGSAGGASARDVP